MRTIECTLCAKVINKATNEHLPQRSLYPKKIRDSINFNTVKACSDCNNGSSKSDEIFKVFIGLIANHEHSNELFYSVNKTLNNNNKLNRDIVNNSTLTKDHGHLISHWNARDYTDIVLESAEKCAKGFYFDKYNEVLIKNNSISPVPTPFIYEKHKIEIEEKLQSAEWLSVNAGTVNFTFLDMKNTDIIIIINFFDSAEFVFCIRDKEYNKKVNLGLINLS
ncbi:hypothetical protein CJF42_05155 [Pseudoalteromonas sp. NBT06-2]|uniref:hypothetical protein n=1 Tax=Pseudoalteromonas sp. NBT06-2 TaxID=2025950 RepID=UPI000BA67E24|nr:hypothetical protein [Pseudoalteromonas sp. NBT06-2]PAJ75526.1 hypothetical protein CJF42_05155 [Pseudoalteromonas sp. NBT06-2]